MAEFKALKEICNKFEEDLKAISTELFFAGVNEPIEGIVVKKLKNLTLFNAKSKLLQAKALSLTQPPPEQDKDESVVLTEYGDTVQWKLIEQLTVKSVTQIHAVRSLMMTPNSKLGDELAQRKEKILRSLSEYGEKEAKLQELDGILKEKEDELAQVRERWHQIVGEMRDLKAGSELVDEVDSSGPYYSKLVTVCNKISIMRWLIGSLVEPRTLSYDWLRDQTGRLAVIKAARRNCDISQFLH